MPTLAELKASSPEYQAMSDLEFASRVYRKHYAEKMGFPEFAQKVGFSAGPAADPTEGMSTFDKVAAGFGKSIVDTGRGLGQLVGLVDQGSVDAAANRDAALMDAGAGMVGNIAGQVGQIAIPASTGAKVASMVPKAATGLGRIAQAALGAGAFGASQPVLEGDSRVGNAAASAAFGAGGQVLGNAVGAIARGGSQALDPARKALAAKAEALGIPLTMAQLSDNSTVKLVSSVLDRIPFAGGGKRADGQREAFTRAVARTFGEPNAARITPDVADAAKKRLGKGFDDLSNRNVLKVDNQLMGDLAAITSGVAKEGSQENARIVGSLVDEFMEKAAGDKVTGQAYRQLDSKLGKLMRQTSDGDRRAYVGAVRDAIRGAMDRSISPKDQKAWKEVRKQYAALKTVEDLIEKAPTGELSPALLMGRVRANTGNMAYGGGGDLADLARIAQAFLKDPIPDSGTAQRALVQQLMAAGAIGGGASMAGASPQDILIGLAGARLGNSALNSKALQRYYQRGMGNSAQRVLQGPQRVAPLLLPASANASGE